MICQGSSPLSAPFVPGSRPHCHTVVDFLAFWRAVVEIGVSSFIVRPRCSAPSAVSHALADDVRSLW